MKQLQKIFLIGIIFVLFLSACATTLEAPVTENNPDETTVEQNQPEPTIAVDESQTDETQSVELVENSAITFTDGTGREITLPSVPQRNIVAGKATPYVLDTIFLFPDVAEKMAAIELRSFDTQSFLQLVDSDVNIMPMLERDSGPEQIAPYQPDLVILKNISLGKL